MNAPAHWPQRGDTDLVAARKIAIVYRTHLHTANPRVCDAVDDAMRAAGFLWVVPNVITYEMDTLVPTAEAAQVAGVGVETIRQWRKRGYLDRDGHRRYLEVRGLDEHGWPLFQVREVLSVAAATRSRRKAA